MDPALFRITPAGQDIQHQPGNLPGEPRTTSRTPRRSAMGGEEFVGTGLRLLACRTAGASCQHARFRAGKEPA